MVRLVRSPAAMWTTTALTALWTIQAALFVAGGAYEPMGLQIYLMAGFACLAANFGLFAARSWKRGPGKTAAQLAAEQEAEQERLQQIKFEKAAKRETKYLMKRIPEELAIQNRVQHQIARDTGTKGKRKVVNLKLRDALITQTEVWFPLRSSDFPYGTGFSDLLSEQKAAIENLQYGIHRHCRPEIDQEYHHVFLVVSFRNSSGGLPLTVHWSKVHRALAHRSRYSVIMGVNKSGKVVTQDLTKWPHGLDLGGTGNGKTTWLKQAFISLVRRNSPDQLKFVLLDLKQIDFYDFGKIPHVIEYVDDVTKAVPAIEKVVEEMERRFLLLKGVAKDIDGWNQARPGRKLPRIFLWCDELARLTRGGDAQRRKDSISLILTLVAQGRAVGIHVLLGTQTITKEVLPSDITANIDGRICFGVRNVSMSILAIMTGEAVGLNPPGRAAIVDGSNTIYVQSPIATAQDIKESLKMAATGEIETLEGLRNAEKFKKRGDWGLEEFYKQTFNEFEGYPYVNKIHKQYPRFARDRMRADVAKRDRRYFPVNGGWAYQHPPQNGTGRGRTGRKAEMVKCWANEPDRLLSEPQSGGGTNDG